MSVNLLSIGPLRFDLVNNIHEYERDTSQDYARKDVIGARRPIESVGAGDDELRLAGRLFPDRIGGRGAMDILRALAATGAPQLVLRGGAVLGWFVVTKVGERGSFLDSEGNAAMIETSVSLLRCGQPAPADVFSSLVTLFG